MEPERTTTLGTPTSPLWDDAWVAEVDSVEKQLDRRICGAHSPAYTPCTLGSNHPTGRCRYHGGHSLIGAPLGNRNAMIHGLYSRRLQQCDDHCPLWQTCPMPDKDLEALPLKERPYCPYEKKEYDHILDSFPRASDAVRSAPNIPLDPPSKGDQGECSTLEPGDGSPPLKGDRGGCKTQNIDPAEAVKEPPGETLLHHNIATFQVMLTRAQAALGWNTFTEETRADGDKYSMRSSKVSALLQAHMRIARELRQWIRLLATGDVRLALNLPNSPPSKGDQGESDDPEPNEFLEAIQRVLKKGEGVLEESIEFQRRVDAGEIDPDDYGADLGPGPWPSFPAPA